MITFEEINVSQSNFVGVGGTLTNYSFTFVLGETNMLHRIESYL